MPTLGSLRGKRLYFSHSGQPHETLNSWLFTFGIAIRGIDPSTPQERLEAKCRADFSRNEIGKHLVIHCVL